MKSVQEYFCEYEQHHCNKLNKLTHYLGIPLIIISLMGLLAQISWSVVGYNIDLAMIMAAVVTVLFYFRMHTMLAIYMLVCFGLFYYIGNNFNSYVLWGVFIFGWILQFAGHVLFEKEKPSFFDNLIHLLIGPLWILNRIVKCVK